MQEEITSRGIIIVDEEVILLFRRKNNKEYYAIPGGHVEKNETNEECIIREIKEELSINIEVIDLLGITQKDNRKEYIYNCKYIDGTLKLGGEELERNNPNNYYEIRKINIKDIDNIDLYPENVAFIKKAYQERND